MRGAFRKMRIALGVKAFGVNHISMQPGISGPEHDEVEIDHEEVYFVLEGGGTLQIGDEAVEMVPGRWVRVDASETRQMHAGRRRADDHRHRRAQPGGVHRPPDALAHASPRSPPRTWRPSSPCHQRAWPSTNVCQAQSAFARSCSRPQ